jgi:hypothetical protein
MNGNYWQRRGYLLFGIAFPLILAGIIAEFLGIRQLGMVMIGVAFPLAWTILGTRAIYRLISARKNSHN